MNLQNKTGGKSHKKARTRPSAVPCDAGWLDADDCVYTINGENTGCYGIGANEFRYIYWYAADPQNPTYTVSFDADGGSGTMADVTDCHLHR